MMRSAETLLGERGCAKVNLQIRTSNSSAVRFYESIGYSFDDVVSMGRRLVDDEVGVFTEVREQPLGGGRPQDCDEQGR
jgi:hypothetical protein